MSPEDLIALLWDCSPQGWTDDDQEILGGFVADLWNQTEDRLDAAEDAGRPEGVPHFVDESWSNDAEIEIVARLWCQGFLRGVAAWPTTSAEILRDPKLAPHLALLRAIVADPSTVGRDAVLPADKLARAIGAAVLAFRGGLPA